MSISKWRSGTLKVFQVLIQVLGWRGESLKRHVRQWLGLDLEAACYWWEKKQIPVKLHNGNTRPQSILGKQWVQNGPVEASGAKHRSNIAQRRHAFICSCIHLFVNTCWAPAIYQALLTALERRSWPNWQKSMPLQSLCSNKKRQW